MEISLRPTLLGRLQEFFYQPPNVRLCCWRGGQGEKAEFFRAPTPMLEGGFVISPLLRDNATVREYYEGKSDSKPSAVSLELGTRDRRFYQESFSFRVYSFQKPDR